MPRALAWMSPDLPLLDARSPLPLDGPFSGAEAREKGVSPKQLRTCVRRGLVREVVHGAYVAMQVPDTIALRASALRLVLSPAAVVTDRTAAWLHGIDVLPRSAVHAPVPLDVFSTVESRVRRPGIHSGIRGLAPADISEVAGVAATTPARTALDLGRLMRRHDALGALDAFLRYGVPRETLESELGRFKGYRGVVQLRALLPIADPRAESMPESALRLHALDAGLSGLQPQLSVAGYRVDLGCRELRYAAEYCGRAFHSGERREADLARTRALEDDGWLVQEFWSDDVYGPSADPGRMMREGMHRARLRLGAWRPEGLYLGH